MLALDDPDPLPEPASLLLTELDPLPVLDPPPPPELLELLHALAKATAQRTPTFSALASFLIAITSGKPTDVLASGRA